MAITHTQHCCVKRNEQASINCSVLPGSFFLSAHPYYSGYILSWAGVKHPLDIKDGRISISSNGAVVGAVDIWAGNFPPTPAGQLEIPFISSGTREAMWVDFTISLDVRAGEQATHTLAARSAGEADPPISPLSAQADGQSVPTASVLHHSLNNVCFHFPRTSRQLWSNEDNLRKLSTYYNALLSSDFAEGSTSTQVVPFSSSLPEYTDEDSDAETDELEVGWKVKSKKGEEQAQQGQDHNKVIEGVPFKSVTVVDTACTTYFAALVWIATGYIKFAPIRSKFRSDDRGAKQARAAELEQMLSQSDSQFTPPASPKSLYRLAHFLELPDLVQLALDNFKSQLSPDNVAYELYSDVSCSYEAVRDTALDFAVANWKEVAKAEGTLEMEQKGAADELPKGATGISMLLARKLTAKS
ncbi:hypothetical protein JCM1840_007177 [Sporobolomyces johnsonii]